MKTSTFLCIILIISCFACKNKRRTTAYANSTAVRMDYAEQLSIDSCDGYFLAKVRNPWDTAKILHTYILVEADKEMPRQLPQGTVVRIPLSRALVYSSVHCSLVQELGGIGQIGGICDLQYIKLPEIQKRCADGKIMDAGNAMSPDVERIIDFHPDAILLSPFENSGGYGRIEKLGVPIIECADYMETSPLGRAEWMRFFGMLFGHRAQADSIFGEVCSHYSQLCKAVENVRTRPTLISELRSGSAWYMPAGHSTMGRLYQDAGADYLWANDTRSGSIPLSFESVFEKGKDADFWLFKYNQPTDKTLASLKEEYSPYASFKAFERQQIYACNTNEILFYEETPFHPDWLLKDLIIILHPEIFPEESCRYFKRLNP